MPTLSCTIMENEGVILLYSIEWCFCTYLMRSSVGTHCSRFVDSKVISLYTSKIRVELELPNDYILNEIFSNIPKRERRGALF